MAKKSADQFSVKVRQDWVNRPRKMIFKGVWVGIGGKAGDVPEATPQQYAELAVFLPAIISVTKIEPQKDAEE